MRPARIINRVIFARIATYAEAVHEIPQKQEVGAQEFVTCGKRRETLRANDWIPKKKARRSRERQA